MDGRAAGGRGLRAGIERRTHARVCTPAFYEGLIQPRSQLFRARLSMTHFGRALCFFAEKSGGPLSRRMLGRAADVNPRGFISRRLARRIIRAGDRAVGGGILWVRAAGTNRSRSVYREEDAR